MNEQRYVEVARLLRKAVRMFVRRHGGEVEDLLSVVHGAFVRCCQTYSGQKGSKFSSWVWYKAWSAMQSHLRHQRRRQAHHPVVKRIWEQVEDPIRTEVSTQSDEPERSEDGRDVTELILHVQKKRTQSLRSATIRYLRDQGWSDYRIRRAMEEIRRNMEG